MTIATLIINLVTILAGLHLVFSNQAFGGQRLWGACAIAVGSYLFLITWNL